MMKTKLKKSNPTLSLWDMTLADLEGLLLSMDEKKFRAQQVYEWAFGRGKHQFSEMSNLSKKLREHLEQVLSTDLPRVIDTTKDAEAEKYAFQLNDGAIVESVSIQGPDEEGPTFCLSTQVGCDLACRFCASGKVPYRRNLSAGEIVAQTLALEKTNGRPSHLVYMGMGEPFMNYEQTLKSLGIFQEKHGYNLGARRITVSTVGMVPEIYRFAEEDTQVNLAVSLHATTDRKRQEIMPIARVYTLRQLLDACWYYTEKTNRRLSFEYILIRDVNDSHHDADRLAALLKGKLAHVNVIPCNPIAGSELKRPSKKELERFTSTLQKAGVNVTVRYSAGSSIAAACGQLAGEKAFKST
jgi:23S rRNA (adenine2503-C2)-methyltransferase